MAIVITVPQDAACVLFAGVPEKRDYFSTVKNSAPIAPTEVGENGTVYCFEGLAEGLYHCCVSKEGYNSLCQVINHTGCTRLTLTLDKLAGGGFEAGYVMRYTPEFNY